MLDQDTKRRIDSCRDILVGKVPDPKSQVEQITIALIYKFMDDMDNESVEMGGKASFFTGDYEKYSWTAIFDPRIGGHELTKLYGEAIEKMNQNPNIPQLFRDIFKNAYLPYRDPETLKLFLKEINNFDYSHSEKLGDAFEYLLSFMGTQGDAGQFRTPRHIIDFIAEVVNPQKHETILDPACGTAGFLISAYKHILKENDNGKKLTPTERKRMLMNFSGYDISPDMVRLSLVNLYLHGFQDPKIYEYDTLTSEDRWDETVDVVLANPPFMTPKGGIRPHKRFAVQAKKSEVLFVDYIAEHLNPNGRAGVIVPEGIIFQSSNAYKALRKMLVEDYLWAVVSLPAGVFQPYSGVKTSILLMDKTKAKQSESILFVKLENDGFDLGAQRRPIDKNDLPEALGILQSGDADNTEIAHWVEKSKIVESGDWNLSGERYKYAIPNIMQSKWNYVELQKVCINPKSDIVDGPFGSNLKASEYTDSGVPVIRLQNIQRLKFINKNIKYISSEKASTLQRHNFKSGDIVVTKLGDPLGKACEVPSMFMEGIIVADVVRVRVNSKEANKKYVEYIINSEGVINQLKGLKKGATRPRVNLSHIRAVQIPLPPLSVQEEIVAEIDGYQKEIQNKNNEIAEFEQKIKDKIGEVWGDE